VLERNCQPSTVAFVSFKDLSEKKTKVKINPKQSEVTEECCPKTGDKECKCNDKTPAQKSVAGKGKTCPECNGKGCKHCGGKGYMDGDSEGADMSEAKKKDDSYLEVNPKKRQANNEKARKELAKGPQMKNPHFESTEEVAETETKLLTFAQFEGYKSLPKEKMARQANNAYGKEQRAVRAGDEKETNKQMQRRIAIKDPSGRKAALKKEEVVNEEGADSLKDRRMERGGVDGNNRYNKAPGKPNTFGKKPGQKYDGMSAVEKVKAKIQKQYGKGAIMDTKKKK